MLVFLQISSFIGNRLFGLPTYFLFRENYATKHNGGFSTFNITSVEVYNQVQKTAMYLTRY